MKFFQTKSLIALILLSAIPTASFADFLTTTESSKQLLTASNEPIKYIDDLEGVLEEDDDNSSATVNKDSFLGTTQASKQIFKTSGKIVKEVFANRNMAYLNNANALDRAFRLRTTADGIFLASYGDNQKNPMVDAKLALRFRYDVGTPALIATAPSSISFAGASVTVPSSSIQKSVLWLRELFVKISLDKNPDKSLHFLKFGSFPYELGRGISLGAAYNSGGFLGLDPRFAIDQFAPGGLLHTDIVQDSLVGEVYYSLLNNPNSSVKENSEIIRLNDLNSTSEKGTRGLNTQSWFLSGALKWKALNLEDTKLNVDPYAYMYVARDQNLEFYADSDSQLCAIGTALEYQHGGFEWAFDTAFQGGTTKVKAWDRNYTSIENVNGVVTVAYTKVYQGDTTTKAVATDANQTFVKNSEKVYTQNGKQIVNDGTDTGLWNAIDRFRPQQEIFYHGYFFVTDMSYELIPKQLKICADIGYSSGHLDEFNNVNNMTQEELMHQNFNGFVPVQSIYSGKRIQHLVMLNTGVPRFTVQYPKVSAEAQHVQSRVMGVGTLTDKFTNIAYTGLALECTPLKFADQKAMIKPVALYYWMPDAPNLSEDVIASHALGTALSIEFMATIKECLDMGGYVGWMVPGPQYKQFSGLQLKGGKLGSDVAYVLNFTMTYKF
ncbi:hypothetical protein KBC04_00235 [Candidatus Babeliales bacterium]|nr:hypothetical protein [Candidatus Babeliales bacterium]MBP9843481.1 hypothetical protein [Candidatus Babeliales bacterium]